MIKIAIIGTGQIGFDLLHKILKLEFVEVVAFVGRRECSKKLPCCDVVFDCTDAYSAIINSKIFFEQGIKVIDLTPSNVGKFYIPNIKSIHLDSNINMVTCGGQASIPLLNYLVNKLKNITYAEVVTQINSESAGMATRINIDKYIDITEKAICEFTNIQKCKVILNINPSINTIMKSTIFIKTPNFDDFDDFDDFSENIQTYIKNYNMSKPVWMSPNLLMVHITVTSSSDLISKCAGNLDIINCAAISALKTMYYNK